MTIEDIKEILTSCKKHIEVITQRWEALTIVEALQELKTLTQSENFWLHQETQTSTLKKIKHLEALSDAYTAIIKTQNDLVELVSLVDDSPETIELIGQETHDHLKKTIHYKITLLLDQEDDDNNCFLSINAGAGGTEAQDWASMLLRMYVRFCEQSNLTAGLVDYQSGEEAGIKSATLFIKGDYACGLLSGEQGIHRLVRVSPFDANKRRHTSFAAVSIAPEVADIHIVINPADLRIDTFRAGGAGGQHVNKTDSAVRITHIPSGIVTQCQNERSQLQNKETAMKMLKSRLYQKEKDERLAHQATLEKKKIEWGSQIRSYILHPYKLVKDHRTDYEHHQPEKVLDGEIMGFIENFLIQRVKTTT